MPQENPQISVVILCYKAGESAYSFVSKTTEILEKRGISYELVLVANYNREEEGTDITLSVVRDLEARNQNIRVVAKVKEGMFGWDVRSGLEIARGDMVAFIDGDGQMPAEDIVRVYDDLLVNKSDMSTTFRVKRHDSLERVFISRVYNVLLRMLFPKISVYDANAKPKIFTRDAFEKLNLKSDDWFIDAEIVIQATEQHFNISQIPTVFLKNVHRSSFVKVGTIFEFLGNLIRYRFVR